MMRQYVEGGMDGSQQSAAGSAHKQQATGGQLLPRKTIELMETLHTVTSGVLRMTKVLEPVPSVTRRLVLLQRELRQHLNKPFQKTGKQLRLARQRAARRQRAAAAQTAAEEEESNADTEEETPNLMDLAKAFDCLRAQAQET